MSEISDLKKAILDDDVALSSILRKAKVLAYSLKIEEMKEWVEKEMNGYDYEKDVIPTYRIIQAYSTGDFSRGSRNFPIPSVNLPENLREWAETATEIGSIKKLESIIDTARTRNEFSLIIAWPGDYIVRVSRDILTGEELIGARKIVSRNQLEEIVEVVRNRLLDFILELENRFPESTPEMIASKPEAPEQVTQIFKTTIHGDVHGVIAAPNSSGGITVTEQKGAVNVCKQSANQQSNVSGDASIAPTSKKSFWGRLFDWIKTLAG